MELVQIALAGLVAWIVLKFALSPVMLRAADRAAIARKPVRAAAAAVVQTLGNIAFWFTLSAAAALAIVLYLTRIEPATLAEAEDALARVRAVGDAIDAFGRGTGALALGVAVLGLLIWTWRRVRRRTADELTAALAEEMQAVQRAFDAGTAEELPPSAAMREIGAEIDKRRQALGSMQEAQAAETADPETVAVRAQIHDDIERLSALVHQLDLYRRAEARLGARQKPAGRHGFWRRVGTFFVSEGMVDTMSAALRVAAAVALLATVPASLSLVGPLAADRLDEKREALADDAREFRFALEQGEINQAFAALATPRPSEVPEPALDDEDEQIADEIAKIYEANLIGDWVRAARHAQAPLRAVVRERVRSAVLARAAERSPAVMATEATARQASATMAETEALLARSMESSRPVTPLGQRAAAENRRIARENPALWSEMRQRYTAYRASFGRAAPAPRVYALAVSQALGDSLGGLAGEGSFFANQARGFGASIGSDAAGSYFEASYRKFVIEAAKTGDFARSAANSGNLVRLAFPPEHVQALAEVVEAMPEPADLERHFRDRRSTLSVEPARGDYARAQMAVQRYAGATGRPLVAADALAEFADYFPGRPGEEQRTRRASIAREASLHGAPPAPGSESARYARRSQRIATRWGSYRALRGFSRIGGVLIGRTPESEAPVEVDLFEWSVSEGRFRFRIAAGGRPAREFGPYSAAIANLALAYAADGRPTTVTMVSAEPLHELKILTHPALVDTGLGCRARRLDQFADEMTGENPRLAEIRTRESEMAVGEVALYRLARALQIAVVSSDPLVGAQLSAMGADGLVEEARRELEAPSAIEQAAMRAAEGGPLTLAEKPEYFDDGLTARIAACLPAAEIDAFAGCIAAEVQRETPAAIFQADLDWLAPVPEYQLWSGVRELPYTVDGTFAYLMPEEGRPLWPFEFIVQLAITSPAHFADPSRAWYDEDNTAIEDYVDPKPWEFPATGAALGPAIAAGLDGDPERRGVFADMAEFAVLQRFFRSAIDGPLSDSFPLDELVRIEAATAAHVNRDAPTLRWNVRPGSLETSFLRFVEQTGGDGDAASACAALMPETDLDVRRLAAMPPADWEASCGPAAFPPDRDLRAAAEQIAAARELRLALEVAADEPLAERLYTEGCPTP